MSDWTNPSADGGDGRVTTTTAGLLDPDRTTDVVDLRRWPVSEHLSRYVENHWGLRWQLPEGASYLSQVLPHPSCNLSLEHATQPREGVAQHSVILTGVTTRRFDVPIRGSGAVVAAKFRPGGLAHLLGTSARPWTDRTLDAAEALPREASRGLAALDPELLQGVGLEPFEAVLRALADAPVERDEERYDQVLDMVADMLADRTVVAVAQVVERHGIPERTLQRWFGHYVGVGPKWVLGRYRMHDVVSELDAGYDGALTDLAHHYGWYDQSHFIRDFKRLVGVSPTEYADRRGSVPSS